MAAAASLVDAAAAAAQATASTPRGGVLRSIPLAARIATATVLAIALLTTSGIMVIPRVVAAMSASSSIKTPVPTPTNRASTSPVDTPAFAAVAARYIPTVLILDASGSMVRDVPGGGSSMDAARSAATTPVQGFGNEATEGLTVFGTSTGNNDADRTAGCSDVGRLLPVGEMDKNAFTSAIAGIQQSGFTPLGPALTDAAAQLGAAETALIVLVTDGIDTCAPVGLCHRQEDQV